MPNNNKEATITELMRVLTAAAGVPMNLDQVMEQLPTWAESSVVSQLLRELKDQGRTSATIEDGRVAYALADRPAPVDDVIHLDGRRTGDRARSTIEKVRDLLREATGPMTPAEVAAAIPDETLEKVQRALHQGKHRGEFDAVSRGPRSKAYARKGGIAVAIAIDGQAPPPDPAPPAAPSSTPAPAASAKGRPALASLLDRTVQRSETALDAYIASVGNVTVYRALQSAVDAAREARAALGR